MLNRNILDKWEFSLFFTSPLSEYVVPLIRKEKVTVIRRAVARAVVWEGSAVEFGWRIRNVFREIGCVLDRMCNTV